MISTLLKAIAFDCIEPIFENSPIKLGLDRIKIVIINPKLFSNRSLDRKHAQLCKSTSWCIVVWIQGIVKWLRLRQWNRRLCWQGFEQGFSSLGTLHEPIEKVLSGSLLEFTKFRVRTIVPRVVTTSRIDFERSVDLSVLDKITFDAFKMRSFFVDEF